MGALLVGALCNAVVRSSGIGFGTTLLCAVAAAVVVCAAPSRRLGGLILIGLGYSFALWLAVRSSPWLVPLNLAAAVTLTLVGASYLHEASLWSLSAGELRHRAAHLVLRVGRGPAAALRLGAAATLPTASSPGQAAMVAKGLGLALPLLALLGGLLAWADAVFASLLTPHFDPGPVLSHGWWLTVGAIGVVSLGGVARTPLDPRPKRDRRHVGGGEATIALSGMVALYTVFVATQVVAQAGGDRYVAERAGLTYAEYARSGFFQLLAVAAITLVVLLTLRVSVEAPSRAFRALGAAVALLTLAIVAGALRRLALYEDAFGRTMLRWFSTSFAWWLAVVLVIVAVAMARREATRLTALLLALGLAWLTAVNAVNPEAAVARTNLLRAQGGPTSHVALDVAYLDHLSNDAVPTLVAGAARLSEEDERALRLALCVYRSERAPWLGTDVADLRARSALADWCAA